MDINTKLYDCQTKNYLLNNGCICWDEKTEFYNNCRFYIQNTIDVKNSPWAKDSNVISHYKNIGLSVLQKRIIQYINHHFFQWGNPSYLKMQTLANRMQTTRRAIIRAISRLIERKILLRVHIFSDKYKQARSILLPSNPLKIKLINRINNLHTKRSLPQGKRSLLQKNRSDRLIFKLRKSLQNNRCIIDYIYSFNTLYSQFTIKSSKRNNKATLYTQRQKRCADSESLMLNERNKDTMKKIPRYKLNPPLPETSLDKKYVDLVSSVDFDIFNLPDEQRKNLLSYIEAHTYDFEFYKMFSDKKLNARHPIAQKQIRQLLSDYLKLFFSNEPLNHESTDYVLRYWNNVDNPKFSKHKTDPNSITYTRLLILTNYVLKFYYNNDMTKFLKVIERFERYGSQNHYLANTLKKWKLDQLILLRNSNGTKKYFLNAEKDFESELFKYRSKHKDAAKRWKDIYVESFYSTDKKKGLEKYNMYHNKLDSFLDLLINRIGASRRELYRRNLTKRMLIDKYETDSVLAEYCDWISFSIAKRPNIFDLCNYDHYMQFVYQEMRGVRGMENFWKPIST